MAAAGPRAMARSDGVLSGIHARRRCGRTDATAAGRSRSRKPRCGWPRPRWRTATPPCPRSVANSDHPRDALPVRRAAGPVARARREEPRHVKRSALDRDAARKCPKRAFTTQADRLRPRLEGGRLPVAGPAARRATGRGRRRRPRLPRRRVRRPRRPTGALTAACARSGRATCSSSGSSTASAAPSPIWSTPCRARRLSGV